MKLFLCSELITSFENKNTKVSSNQVIVVKNDRIESVQPADSFDLSGVDSSKVIRFDDSNMIVIPGLIDAHLHLAHSGTDISEKADPDPLVALRMAHNAFQNLKAGITSVRDMGAKNHIDIHFKNGVALGLVPSPRVSICGKPIIITGGHCHYMGREADGPDEMAKAVREQIKMDVDFVKIMVTGGVMTPGAGSATLQMQKAEILSTVEVAYSAGKPVSAHAQAGPGIALAINCGVQSIEHGNFLEPTDIELMAKNGTYYVPTLTAFKEIAEDGHKINLPAWAIEKAAAAVDKHEKSYRLAREAGLTIAAGTDYRHGTLLNELRLMVAYGASATEALESATINAAKVIQRAEDLGSIAPGKLADFTVIAGNPMKDINNLNNIIHSVIGGEVRWSAKG
jgi:imidazolonepropionase-like amidohydrolase